MILKGIWRSNKILKKSWKKFKLRETFKLSEVVQGAHVHEVLTKIAIDSGIFFIHDW
jgi:hypothetical protein